MIANRLQISKKMEKLVDQIDEDTVSYISSMFSTGSLTEEQSSTTAGLMYVLNDIARVSKRCEDITPVLRAKLEGKYKFSKDAVEELARGIDAVEVMYQTTISALDNGDSKLAKKVLDYRKELRSMEKRFNKNHLKTSAQEKLQTGIYLSVFQYASQLRAYRRQLQRHGGRSNGQCPFLGIGGSIA